MDNSLDRIFSTPEGVRVYQTACDTVKKYGMDAMIKKGVLLGLSGGADSVMLMYFLLEYRRKNYDFPILATHINHMIRGEAADGDEQFSRELCSELGVEFLTFKIDVPKIAQRDKIGIEECARNVRYSKFGEIISGRNDISTIAVAHNRGDAAETVVYNIMRGAGTRGAGGIPPVRDNIVRPLIAVSKPDIVAALGVGGAKFVTDLTNLSTDYTRNYIRHELMPAFQRISPSPEAMLYRFAENLRQDEQYLTAEAEKYVSTDNSARTDALRELHPAIRSRVIVALGKGAGVSLSHSHITAICELLSGDDFSYSLPGGAVFFAERGECRVLPKRPESADYFFMVDLGRTELSGFDADFFLSKERIDNSSLNVYKISIQVNLKSAIIDGGLFLRPRVDGDTLYYGKMTHKLKKLLCDRKIPSSLRSRIPVLCDCRGPLWVAGFGVRDDGASKTGADLYAALCIGKGSSLTSDRMYSADEFV
ncbi:MAG: tRNA lysidine(34) synthetase TilS [Clostridia bacterium]|nr:tRNA lysidine(34) synthetase TilS [Clostridia bacterium]